MKKEEPREVSGKHIREEEKTEGKKIRQSQREAGGLGRKHYRVEIPSSPSRHTHTRTEKHIHKHYGTL